MTQAAVHSPSRPFNPWLFLALPLGLAALLLAFEPVTLDLALANLMYDPGAGFIGRHSWFLENILHDRVKQLVIAISVLGLQGFRSGADDYLVKPFALSELSARIEAVLRRAQGGGRRELSVADLSYDLDTLEVKRAGKSLKLNPIGLKLLAVLMQKSPHVVRRDALEEAVWGDDCPDSDSLRSHVHQLRQVIDKPFSVALLHTVHGVGYRLAEEPNGV